MLDDPERYRIPHFADQRVRMVQAIVEFRDRVPCGVIKLVYQMLSFDAQGRLDLGAFKRQNAAPTTWLDGVSEAKQTLAGSPANVSFGS